MIVTDCRLIEGRTLPSSRDPDWPGPVALGPLPGSELPVALRIRRLSRYLAGRIPIASRMYPPMIATYAPLPRVVVGK